MQAIKVTAGVSPTSCRTDVSGVTYSFITAEETASWPGQNNPSVYGQTGDAIWMSKLHAEEKLLCDRWREMILSAALRLIFKLGNKHAALQTFLFVITSFVDLWGL